MPCLAGIKGTVRLSIIPGLAVEGKGDMERTCFPPPLSGDGVRFGI